MSVNGTIRKCEGNTKERVFLAPVIQFWSLRFVFFRTVNWNTRLNNIKHVTQFEIDPMVANAKNNWCDFACTLKLLCLEIEHGNELLLSLTGKAGA